jgi:hypothetical protein
VSLSAKTVLFGKMFGNEAFSEYYFSNDSTRSHQPKASVVLSKRARNEGDEEETVIQSMVKRLRVDDDSTPPSPVPLFQHQNQFQQQQMCLPQYSEDSQTQYMQHLHQQQYINQHHQHPIQPTPLYATVQSHHSNLAVSTDRSLVREQCPLTPQERRQQLFRSQQQQEFQQQQQLQVSGDVSEELPFVSPMNKLLGSLHQQRRANTWQRQEQLLLPSNTQLF